MSKLSRLPKLHIPPSALIPQISITYKWRVACCSRVSTFEAGQTEKMAIAGGPEKEKMSRLALLDPDKHGKAGRRSGEKLRQ